MGWSSGTYLMEAIIEKIEGVLKDYNLRKEVYKIIISEMENLDWDCYNECMQMDDAYDEALIELHPEIGEDD